MTLLCLLDFKAENFFETSSGNQYQSYASCALCTFPLQPKNSNDSDELFLNNQIKLHMSGFSPDANGLLTGQWRNVRGVPHDLVSRLLSREWDHVCMPRKKPIRILVVRELPQAGHGVLECERPLIGRPHPWVGRLCAMAHTSPAALMDSLLHPLSRWAGYRRAHGLRPQCGRHQPLHFRVRRSSCWHVHSGGGQTCAPRALTGVGIP